MALSTQRASASFPSNESTPPWEYDVFLSFRGVDTRKGFVSHLYGELFKWLGIRTFFDDRELEGGTSIHRELPSAIQKSHTAIVVLSPNYASSKWCLDELTTILQCMEARESVLPVFYETDPSDVGNQRGCFGKAFSEHERNLISTDDKEKVVQWKADVKKVSKITGKHWKNFKCDRELIEDIVKWVWEKVQATLTPTDSSWKLVGTDYALEHLNMLLAHDANDIRFIGITGMGGIGKTTLANLVYDKILHDFDVHCFLANVREECAKYGIVDLAKKLLSRLLKERSPGIWVEERVSILIEKFLRNKKVLLVLDDVDELKQLEVLAGNQGWFGMGSRIIVTTRNQRLLVEHGIETSYKVQGLNDAEALKLFSQHAFKKDQPKEDFLELSMYFVNHARGLPLALKTLGSALFKRGLAFWNSERDNLKKIPNQTVFHSLKVSYDGLEKMEKRIFLDVACLHKGKLTTKVVWMLDNSFGISTSSRIDKLIERSLLYNGYENRIWMHDLIQEMAWTIVREESEESGQRSRLWLFEDINRVFTTNTGTEAIEAISLCLPKVEEVPQWNWEAFSKMHRLRFLEFDNLVFFSGPKFLPHSLRIINWRLYPSKFLPISCHLRLLTQLKMLSSNLVRLWEGKVDLPNLKYIDLSGSNKLMSTPDFSGLPNLGKLKLDYCENLVEIHPSIAVLKRLKYLYLDGCYNLKNIPKFGEQMKNLRRIHLRTTAIEEIPSSIGHMVDLKELHLLNCKNLKKIPEFGEQMKKLWQIELSGTAIEEIPSSIGHLVGLKELYLDNCKNLKKIAEFGEQMKKLRCITLRWTAIEEIPSSIRHLVGLKELHLLNCKNLKKIPEFAKQMKNLWRIQLSGTAIEEIPSSIGHLVGLKELYLDNCKNLKKIPEFGEQMKKLRCITLRWTAIEEIPSSIGHLVGLKELHLLNCKNLKKIPKFGKQMKNLWRIQLSGTAIEEIPSSIGHMVGLKELYLDNCKNLKKIPEFGEQMMNLCYICLSGSAIEEIPSSIGHLVGLKELHLDNCKNLKKIPEFGEQMKNLCQIKLSGTAIEEIPSSIGYLVSLKELHLINCKNLKKIPEFGEQMKNLWWINLSGAGIEEMPLSLGHLVGLRQLHLDNCKNLKKIPEFGEQMINLCYIYLSGSAIEEIPSSIGHLVGLQKLHLDNCKNLKKIPEFGEQMKNLWRIKLSGTGIEEIPSSIGHLVGLKELDLENCKNLLNLPMAIYSLKSLERLVFDKSDEGSKARDGCGLLRCLTNSLKIRLDPPRLCSLRKLSLRDCELCEGDIPDDIDCLSSLEELYLSGNNFVSLPESIRCLSKLWSLDLERCKSLHELPPLPSKGHLYVNIDNCTSLKRLLDPAKMMSRYIHTNGKELFCYKFFCLNCIALAQDEGWINTILSTILRFATTLLQPEFVWRSEDRVIPGIWRAEQIVIPGSEIPGWFNNQSVGHSVNVDLPPPSCTDWLGIAFCVVFQDPKQNSANPAALPQCDEFDIRVRGFDKYTETYKIGSLMSKHLWVFYLDREVCYQVEFLFETNFDAFGKTGVKANLNAVQKCGARLLYKQDLEELNQTLKILK